MKYSLRSLMVAVLVLPPLLAVGWSVWTAMFPPLELVDNCGHFVHNLDWKAAVADVEAKGFGKFQTEAKGP